ncbi:unnamed protein product [Heligmosomoides polygyrus]|uniref:Nuclear pore membrane glycoprotein n=1 Tax=Heligmosomoides polygyrus TaxID=6339 RepID=A0A183GR61_HELPZ|nr:unnamed protein product [Heligmosomoides polygyrus]
MQCSFRMGITHFSGSLLHFLLIFALALHCSSAYRLNVPRVLLPYHPTIPVKFLLEVSQPSGGCFNWRSTRPDVVSVTPIESKLGECSDKAEIRATAKAVSGELSAVIFAEDSASGTMLSCGVTVDQISKIHVETTNKILFVDAAPARMMIEAFNAEGDKFSTLSEIPVNWELSHSGDGRPLRIVPFEQSTYEAPPEIMALESNKKKGYVILVEGVLTGSATLTARFAEPHFDVIKAHSLELTVVANLLLLPAHDLYLPVHSVVPFQVQIVRQSSTEVVPMPSASYYLKVDSDTICSLDKMSSSIRALTRGRTVIHLFSQNVDVKAKTGVRPPSTAIYVVDPESIQWVISGGGNWLLQTGTRYKLSVLLLDPHGNTMYISDVSGFFYRNDHCFAHRCCRVEVVLSAGVSFSALLHFQDSRGGEFFSSNPRTERLFFEISADYGRLQQVRVTRAVEVIITDFAQTSSGGLFGC